VGPGAKGKPHMVAKGADVRTCIALYPEQDESPIDIEYFQITDLAYTEHSFDSTLSRRALVQPPRELLSHLHDTFPVNIMVQPHQADIFLLMLEQKRGGEQIVKSVESIAMISRQNLVAVEQMSAAAKALAGESEGLQQRVQAFQV
jgi:hypothetical protein